MMLLTISLYRACCILLILTIWLHDIVQAELLFQPLKTDTNNLPDLSQLLCVPINTDELDTITSNMGTIFSNMLETVAPIKLKKVREKRAAPWYNSYTHSLKKETRILERKWRKTNLEVFRIAWKNSMSSYRLGMGHDFRIFDLIIEYRLGCAIIL